MITNRIGQILRYSVIVTCTQFERDRKTNQASKNKGRKIEINEEMDKWKLQQLPQIKLGREKKMNERKVQEYPQKAWNESR